MLVQLRPVNQELVNAFQHWATKAELAEYFRHRLPLFSWKTQEGTLAQLEGAYGIYEDDKLVGVVQLTLIDFVSRNCSLSMLIDTDLSASRLETGRSAYDQILKYCFDTMQMHRVYMRVLTTRTKFINRVQSGGWRIEGHLIQSCFVNGEPKDEFILGLLKSERR